MRQNQSEDQLESDRYGSRDLRIEIEQEIHANEYGVDGDPEIM